jgi:hypothetical protein
MTPDQQAAVTELRVSIADARQTPWGDGNARTRPPEGPQLTLFSPA